MDCTQLNGRVFASKCFASFSSFYELTWAAANTACVNRGGSLPTVHSSAENNVLRSFASSQFSPIWLGLTNSSNIWTDNTAVDFSSIVAMTGSGFSSSSSSLCAAMSSNATNWTYLDCSSLLAKSYVCQFSIFQGNTITGFFFLSLLSSYHYHYRYHRHDLWSHLCNTISILKQ